MLGAQPQLCQTVEGVDFPMGTEDNGVGRCIGSSKMNSGLGSALSCVQVTERADPAVHSLMSKLLIRRGMVPMESEIVLKAREPEPA